MANFNKEDIVKRIGNTDSVILETIDNFLNRGEAGFLKYNETMDRNDLELVDWITHSIEEQMDNILYLTKIKRCILQKQDSNP